MLLLIGVFYFAQPWIVYYTNSHWSFDLLSRNVESGSYWGEAVQRGLIVDDVNDLKDETVFLNKKIQKLDRDLFLLQCDGISEWGSWLTLYTRYPLSDAKSEDLVKSLKIKGSEDNANVTQNVGSVPIRKLFGSEIHVILPSSMQVEDRIVLQIGDREVEIEIEKVSGVSK